MVEQDKEVIHLLHQIKRIQTIIILLGHPVKKSQILYLRILLQEMDHQTQLQTHKQTYIKLEIKVIYYSRLPVRLKQIITSTKVAIQKVFHLIIIILHREC